MNFGTDEEIKANFENGAYPESFIRYLRDSNKECLKWSDIEHNLKYPEYDVIVDFVTTQYLGYIPPKYFTIKPAIRLKEMIYKYKNGQMDGDEFGDGCASSAIQMRNIEMNESGHVDFYDASVYEKYKTHFPENATRARKRITRVLGYEPRLEHSALVELHMRNLYASDELHFPEDQISTTDIQCATIIKFREVLTAKGKDAAFASYFTAKDLIKRFK